MSDTEKRYIQLKNEYWELLIESGSLLKAFRTEDMQLGGDNEGLSHWEEFQFEFQLLILAAELWMQTAAQEYLSAMNNYAQFLRSDIIHEMEDIYGREVDAFLEYKLILQYLIGEKCCECIIDQMHPVDVNLSATSIDGRYFVIKMVQLVSLLHKKGLEAEAELSVRKLLELDFLKYDQHNAGFVKSLLYLRLATYYYLPIDWKRAYTLYQQHHMRMQKLGGYDFIHLCNILAEIQEVMDLAASVSLCDDAYEQLERFKQFVPMEEQWRIRYNHIWLHFKMEKISSFSEEAESLFEELESQECDLTEGGQIVKLQVSYLILLYASYNHMQGKYLRQALVFYDLSNKLDDLVKESPAFNRKVAAFHLGCVYAARDELMTAESYFIEAENLADIYPNKHINYYVLTNLNMLYLLQHDIEHAVPYANRLYKEILDGNYPPDVRQQDIQRNILVFSGLHEMTGNRENSAAVLREALEEGVIYNDGSSVISGVYNAVICRTIGLHNCLPEEYGEKFTQYLSEIEVSDFYRDLSLGEQLEHLTAKALLYWKMGKTGIYVQCRTQALSLADQLTAWDSNLIPDLYGIFMAVDMEKNDADSAVFIARLIWDKYSYTFGKAMVYQNKNRLSAYAQGYGGVFQNVYSILQDRIGIKDSYYLVLNSKNITSLITVFRNFALEKLEFAKDVADEINFYMDRMAEQKMNKLLALPTGDEAELERKLTELEYRFSREVRFKYTFDPFRVEDMMECIPDNSVFLEYVIYIDGIYNAIINADLLNDGYIANKVVINTYCFRKCNGVCEISQYKINNTAVLFEELSYYFDEMGHERHRKTTEVRKRIYHYLIAAFEMEIRECRHLYIAPDGLLCNLPFDVLVDDTGCMLGDRVHITMLDTGRDFFRKSPKNFEGRFIVIGAPAFDYNQARGNEPDGYVRALLTDQEIRNLPFTELEAQVVADEMDTVPFLAQDANKKVVKMLPFSRWAHIATHGMYDIDCGSDAWYSSALLFAGAENWRKTGNIHFKYGNGMVTSDEISRMKLSNMEMVVLSACFAGRTEVSQMAGIRAAFKDAGVKYIVSALWQVDDLAGAVFMSIFYQYLYKETVPEALRLAKIYLREISIAEVIEMVEKCLRKYNLHTRKEIEESLQKLKRKKILSRGDYKPYKDPFYWSGFTCYQNSF